MKIAPEELTRLSILWDHHRRKCSKLGDITLEQNPAGGIGTATKATCSCGETLDITDYLSW